MSAHTYLVALGTMVIPLIASTPANASDQPPGVVAPATSTVTPGTVYNSAKWLTARGVVSTNSENIGTVSDLILDRGTGDIAYVVIKSGTTLGMGGREVIVPFASLRFEFGNKQRVVLASTPEQLKALPEYSAESWKQLRELRSDLKDDTTDTLHRRLASDTGTPSDPYAGGLDTAASTTIEGTVVRVERLPTTSFGEQVVVSVELTDRTTRKVAMGPSWFVNSSLAAPMRGDKLSISALALPRDPDQLMVATELRNGERRLHLRDSKNAPLWALKSIQTDTRSYSTPYSRYLLVSEINGIKIDCRGQNAGKAADLIIDLGSGRLVFIVLDPDQNFLGIGDVNHLVPWTIAAVTLEGTLRLDASKEMILASPPVPSSLQGIGTTDLTARVYKAFDVPLPRFSAQPPSAGTMGRTDGPWSAKGSIAAAIVPDSLITIEGRITDMSEVTFDQGTAPARALTIRKLDGRGDETVLLGPSAYINNQKPFCKTGDTIKLDAYRTTIDGRHFWLARHVDGTDGRIVLLQESAAPVWAQP